MMVNKRVQNAVLGWNLKNDGMISVCYQGKPFNITVIQVYAPTTNAKEAEVEWFCEDLKDILELTPKEDVIFIIGDWNTNVGSQETPGGHDWATSLHFMKIIRKSWPMSSFIFTGLFVYKISSK